MRLFLPAFLNQLTTTAFSRTASVDNRTAEAMLVIAPMTARYSGFSGMYRNASRTMNSAEGDPTASPRPQETAPCPCKRSALESAPSTPTPAEFPHGFSAFRQPGRCVFGSETALRKSQACGYAPARGAYRQAQTGHPPCCMRPYSEWLPPSRAELQDFVSTVSSS